MIFLIPVHTGTFREKKSLSSVPKLFSHVSLRENNFNRVLKKFHPWECSETFWFVIYIFFRIWLTTFYMGFLGMFYLYSGLKNAKIQYFWLFFTFLIFFLKGEKKWTLGQKKTKCYLTERIIQGAKTKIIISKNVKKEKFKLVGAAPVQSQENHQLVMTLIN